MGFFTILASAICTGRGSVHTFEVDPSLIHLITESIAMNQGIGPIYLNCMAVADKIGECTAFSPYQANNLSTNQLFPSTLNSKHVSGDHSQTRILTITIDDYCRITSLFPDLVKMDIEGAEALAIPGMAQTLREGRPTLLLEVHPQ